MRKFQRTIEDFGCENCGQEVEGDGYTNHCPVCLWSKHVDINPGDRKANCGCLMEPISIETEKDEHIITHRCQICEHEKRNKTLPADNFEKIIEISNF